MEDGLDRSLVDQNSQCVSGSLSRRADGGSSGMLGGEPSLPAQYTNSRPGNRITDSEPSATQRGRLTNPDDNLTGSMRDYRYMYYHSPTST